MIFLAETSNPGWVKQILFLLGLNEIERECEERRKRKEIYWFWFLYADNRFQPDESEWNIFIYKWKECNIWIFPNARNHNK